MHTNSTARPIKSEILIAITVAVADDVVAVENDRGCGIKRLFSQMSALLIAAASSATSQWLGPHVRFEPTRTFDRKNSSTNKVNGV